jgi:hypothetical protein
MEPVWQHTAWLLEYARLTHSDRTLTVISWKLLGFGVLVALLVGGGAYQLGWRVPGLGVPASAPSAGLPRTAAGPGGESRSFVRASSGESACHAALRDAGVSFRTIAKDQAVGVAWPIELSSGVGGVAVRGAKTGAPTNYLDCRLGLALLAWAPRLREQGIVGLRHYSIYRRDAVVATTKKQSGHALGLAIDVGVFERRDGRALSVLDDWHNRERGAEPCGRWFNDKEAGRIMRALVCDAYDHGLFQSVVTPHANAAHDNHVHLELRMNGEGGWLE